MIAILERWRNNLLFPLIEFYDGKVEHFKLMKFRLCAIDGFLYFVAGREKKI